MLNTMKYALRTATTAAAVALCTLLLAAGCAGSPTDPDTGSAPTASPEKTGEYAEVNRWMFNYLESHYLWNRAAQQTTPRYTLDYEDFLDDVLTQVAAQDNINREDGHWEAGKRQYFYSYVARYRTGSQGRATRSGTQKTVSGYGFEQLFYANFTSGTIALVVGAVHPEGPAAKAGLQRGDVITRIDGAAIQRNDLTARLNQFYNDEEGTLKLTLYDMNNGDETRIVEITAATYDDNPIFAHKVIALDDGRKAGYLFYNAFNLYYDTALCDRFAAFRTEGIDELILDLRYNGGGHVVSSVLLATLIAGAPYQGQLFARTTFNEDRRNESHGLYRIGEPQLSDNPGDTYAALGTALASALELKRIYVLTTQSTASASELIINGLRGLGLEVRLIGETTNGKNVGMEGLSRIFGSYQYEFSPITFYISNGKGESDYSNGFAPDVEFSESDDIWHTNEAGVTCGTQPGDETYDLLTAAALFWMNRDRKPTIAPATATRTVPALELHTAEVPRRTRPQALLLQ